ncbi:MAG: hypothetical protein ABL951_00245 [Alphaproteobacteria bacterium]
MRNDPAPQFGLHVLAQQVGRTPPFNAAYFQTPDAETLGVRVNIQI